MHTEGLHFGIDHKNLAQSLQAHFIRYTLIAYIFSEPEIFNSLDKIFIFTRIFNRVSKIQPLISRFLLGAIAVTLQRRFNFFDLHKCTTCSVIGFGMEVKQLAAEGA